MQYQTILYEKKEGLGIVTLNRPDNMNALNNQVFTDLKHVLGEIEIDENIRVVIITGGEKFFAAGADISELADVITPVDAHNFSRLSHSVYAQIESMGKPFIAAVSGFALGGGFELALTCDLIIAADNATFGLPEIKIGVMPGAGGTQKLPRIAGVTKAKELLFTGDSIKAEEAHRIGLVNKVVPLQSLMKETMALAAKIARQPGVALKMTKFAVDGGLNMDLKSAIAYEARCFELLFSTADQKEGMNAFVEKRRPVF
jgi:enoyl-CoA hydratase